MSGRIVPIIDISAKMHEFKRVFNEEAFDLMQASHGYQEAENFTFTFRLSLDLTTEEGEADRAYIITRLRALRVPHAEELIKLLDENAWDVSFFADFF